MAITSGFYNSVNGDRTYDADQFGSLFDGIIAPGVFPNVGDKFPLKRTLCYSITKTDHLQGGLV